MFKLFHNHFYQYKTNTLDRIKKIEMSRTQAINDWRGEEERMG